VFDGNMFILLSVFKELKFIGALDSFFLNLVHVFFHKLNLTNQAIEVRCDCL
jgi:hypothetical protein